MRRGDVFMVELAPRSGSEQRGVRPAVVVSHDSFNRATGWRSVIVVPFTTRTRSGPTFVPVEAGAGGLPAASVALCHQVTTLDRAKLTRRLGALTEPELTRIDDGLRAALSLL
jgi:mRNA interferase MazF